MTDRLKAAVEALIETLETVAEEAYGTAALCGEHDVTRAIKEAREALKEAQNADKTA